MMILNTLKNVSLYYQIWNKIMDTLHFTTSINCGGCIAAVTPFLQTLDSVQSWHVDTDNPQKILTITGIDLQEDYIVAIVEKAGFSIKRLEA